jgi:hypothetical protein
VSAHSWDVQLSSIGPVLFDTIKRDVEDPTKQRAE